MTLFMACEQERNGEFTILFSKYGRKYFDSTDVINVSENNREVISISLNPSGYLITKSGFGKEKQSDVNLPPEISQIEINTTDSVLLKEEQVNFFKQQLKKLGAFSEVRWSPIVFDDWLTQFQYDEKKISMYHGDLVLNDDDFSKILASIYDSTLHWAAISNTELEMELINY
jgi:hypothetical protein